MGKRIIFLFVCVLALLLIAAPGALAFGISVTSIDPASARANTTVRCTIGGSFGTTLLDGPPQFELVKDATTIAGSTRSFDGTSAIVDFTLPGSSPLGFYTVNASQFHGIVAHHLPSPTLSRCSPPRRSSPARTRPASWLAAAI